MIFASEKLIDVLDWHVDDPRIHKKANCRYRDDRTVLDILYDLILAGLVEKV